MRDRAPDDARGADVVNREKRKNVTLAKESGKVNAGGLPLGKKGDVGVGKGAKRENAGEREKHADDYLQESTTTTRIHWAANASLNLKRWKST